MIRLKLFTSCAFITAALLLTIPAGCRRSRAPVLWKIDGATVVTVGDSAVYQSYVWSPSGPAIDYHWECTGGRLAWDWGNYIKWFAPESSGTVILRVTVRDTFGLSDSDSLVISVRPLIRTFLNWNGAVKTRTYQSFADTIKIGYRLEGRSGSDTANAYLLLMNRSNFELWRNGQPAEYLERRPLYTRSSFHETIPATDCYYLIIDNTNNTRDLSFWVSVTVTSP